MRSMRGLASSLIIMVFLGLLTVFFYYRGMGNTPFRLTRTTFSTLPGWGKDNHSQALSAFRQSCLFMLRNKSFLLTSFPDHHSFDWTAVCTEVVRMPLIVTKPLAQRFFEKWFTPYHVSHYSNAKGLFTGYYLPVIKARSKPNKQYTVPIYTVPDDLVQVNLSLFNSMWMNQYIVGQLKQGHLLPYPDRAAINKGDVRAPVLAWSNSLLDVFFAEIQGSAILQFPDDKQQIISYAAQNGRPYTAISKWFIKNNILHKKAISMQDMRCWLKAHPQQIEFVLNQNASYVFFKKMPGKAPIGKMQVPLMPGRSLAVDQRYIPLGAPIWVDTMAFCSLNKQKTAFPFQHLLIAQDIGGAIKGIVRGDIYFGSGKRAEALAGPLNSMGEYWILLPRRKQWLH